MRQATIKITASDKDFTSKLLKEIEEKHPLSFASDIQPNEREPGFHVYIRFKEA